MKKQTLYMTTSLLTVLGLGACGDFKSKMVGYKDHNQDRNQIPDRAGSEAEAVSQRKWQKLAAALGYDVTPITTKEELTQYLSAPSKHVKGPEGKPTSAYYQIMAKLQANVEADRGKMRCGGIQSFKPLEHTGKVVTLHGANVYNMTYHDQVAKTDRTALVTIPQTIGATPLPLLLHLVGGDAGLAPFTKEDTDFTPGMLEKYVVIAPDYGMGICADKSDHGTKKCSNGDYLVKPRAQLDLPWEEDVYSALAAHDCVSELVTLVGQEKNLMGKLFIADFSQPQLDLAEAIFERGHQVQMMEHKHPVTGDPLFLGASRMRGPVSKIFGSSRGGLAAFIAAAWAGMEWQSYFQVFAQFKKANEIHSPEDFVKKNAAPDLRKAFSDRFGDNYSKTNLMYPPMFSEIITNGGPFSLTIGGFRLLIRDVVLKIHNPLKEELPGVDRLIPIFEHYADQPEGEDEKALETVVQTIVRRDMHFLHLYLPAALVDWSKLLLAGFDPQNPHMGPGKVLFIHGAEDAVVTSTQAFCGFSHLQNLALAQAGLRADPAKTQGNPRVAFFASLPGIETSLAYALPEKKAVGHARGYQHNDKIFWHESKVAWDVEALKVTDLKAQKIHSGKHPAAFLGLENMSLSPTEFIDQWMAVEVSK